MSGTALSYVARAPHRFREFVSHVAFSLQQTFLRVYVFILYHLVVVPLPTYSELV